MSRYSIVLAIVLVISLSIAYVHAQEDPRIEYDKETSQRLDWLRENAIPIRSIDINDTDFSDLQPLKEKIGDAQVVMLGEQNHGFGTVFLMKGRLIRFLHEEMDFNILAWESGLPCCRDVDAALQEESVEFYDAFGRGVFGIFMLSEQIRPLLEYLKGIRGANKPMIQAGFDHQFSAAPCRPYFTQIVEEFFNKAQPGLLPADKVEELEELLSNYTSALGGEELKNLVGISNYLVSLYKSNKKFLKQTCSKRMFAYYRRVLVNFRELAKQRLNEFYTEPADPENINTRDRAMANSLVFLARKFFNKKKIAVWAASFHTMRNMHLIDTNTPYVDYSEMEVMGHKVCKKLKDKVYSIAPITYEGRAGDVWGRDYGPIPPADEGSISWLLHELGGKYYFLDLKSLPDDHWLREKMPARPMHTAVTLEAKWHEIFDAFVYIETTEPSTRVKDY